MTVSTHASELAGTTRYEVLRRLGAGGFGVVHAISTLSKNAARRSA